MWWNDLKFLSRIEVRLSIQEPQEKVKNHKLWAYQEKLFKVVLVSVKALTFEALPTQASSSFGNGKWCRIRSNYAEFSWKEKLWPRFNLVHCSVFLEYFTCHYHNPGEHFDSLRSSKEVLYLSAIEILTSLSGDHRSLCWSHFAVYKTYTTGQLRIKTVFQNNNIQDSFHAFLFISFLQFSSRVQSSIRGG